MNLILKIIPQVLAVIIAILISLLDYVINDKNSKGFKQIRKWLFALSACFLIGSIFVTISDENGNKFKEQYLQGQLSSVRSQNLNLQRTISILSEDQKSRFNSLFDEQKSVGAETAAEIQNSAKKLHSSINDSITILRKSSKEIDRAANPIKELKISYIISNSLETSTGSVYRKRIEKAIGELTKERNGIKAMGDVYITSDDFLDQRVSITKPQYMPDKKNETAVYLTTCSTFISVDIYKKPVPVDLLKKNSPAPDIHMSIAGSVDNTIPNKNTSYDLTNSTATLFYELNKKDFVISTFNLSPVYLNNATGKIISIPDLSGAQVVIKIGGGFLGSFSDDGNDVNINREIKDLQRLIKLRAFTFRMSEGREIKITSNHLGRFTDSLNDIFYVYQFPNTSNS